MSIEIIYREQSDNKDEIRRIYIENGNFIENGDENLQIDESFDLTETEIFPGFIDVHNHGAVGVDVNAVETADDLLRIGKFLAADGVTAWLPTFVPDADEVYRRVTAAIDETVKIQENEPVAQIVGVHYEGVFANEKMCGALRPQFFKSFQNGDGAANDLPRLAAGAHFTTLAPEIENGIALIKKLTAERWIVSIGHTRAETEVLDEAFAAGARHLTHFFNAMTGLHHRDVGVAGWALAKPDATFDIIADGIHVHPEMLRLAARVKGTDKVSLISDSVAPTGCGDGDFDLWGEKVAVANGKTRNERGSIAGSVITMRDAVRQMRALGFSPAEVSAMASLNPARLLGIDKTHGSLASGKRADLVALDTAGEVKFVLVGGRVAVNNL